MLFKFSFIDIEFNMKSIISTILDKNYTAENNNKLSKI